VVGVLLGLVAQWCLPHVYAAQTTIRFSLGAANSGDDNADRTLTTQTVLIHRPGRAAAGGRQHGVRSTT